MMHGLCVVDENSMELPTNPCLFNRNISQVVLLSASWLELDLGFNRTNNTLTTRHSPTNMIYTPARFIHQTCLPVEFDYSYLDYYALARSCFA